MSSFTQGYKELGAGTDAVELAELIIANHPDKVQTIVDMQYLEDVVNFIDAMEANEPGISDIASDHSGGSWAYTCGLAREVIKERTQAS